MVNCDAGALVHKKMDFVSRTARLFHLGGQRSYKAAIQRDHRDVNNRDNMIRIPHAEI
jgi:hypothetical protein